VTADSGKTTVRHLAGRWDRVHRFNVALREFFHDSFVQSENRFLDCSEPIVVAGVEGLRSSVDHWRTPVTRRMEAM
jgi:hypothetical protein